MVPGKFLLVPQDEQKVGRRVDSIEVLPGLHQTTQTWELTACMREKRGKSQCEKPSREVGNSGSMNCDLQVPLPAHPTFARAGSAGETVLSPESFQQLSWSLFPLSHGKEMAKALLCMMETSTHAWKSGDEIRIVSRDFQSPRLADHHRRACVFHTVFFMCLFHSHHGDTVYICMAGSIPRWNMKPEQTEQGAPQEFPSAPPSTMSEKPAHPCRGCSSDLLFSTAQRETLVSTQLFLRMLPHAHLPQAECNFIRTLQRQSASKQIRWVEGTDN